MEKVLELLQARLRFVEGRQQGKGGVGWRRGDLRHMESFTPGIEEDEVREGAADVGPGDQSHRTGVAGSVA